MGWSMMASRGFQIRPRQIHQGLGASGANPKGQVQAGKLCSRQAGGPSGPWSILQPGG